MKHYHWFSGYKENTQNNSPKKIYKVGMNTMNNKELEENRISGLTEMLDWWTQQFDPILEECLCCDEEEFNMPDFDELKLKNEWHPFVTKEAVLQLKHFFVLDVMSAWFKNWLNRNRTMAKLLAWSPESPPTFNDLSMDESGSLEELWRESNYMIAHMLDLLLKGSLMYRNYGEPDNDPLELLENHFMQPRVAPSRFAHEEEN